MHEQRATLSNGGPASADKVYELRVYSIKPDRYATFCQLMATKFHRRLAYSRPLGYWLTDLGGIFQAVHIWPYGTSSGSVCLSVCLFSRQSTSGLLVHHRGLSVCQAVRMWRRSMVRHQGLSVCLFSRLSTCGAMVRHMGSVCLFSKLSTCGAMARHRGLSACLSVCLSVCFPSCPHVALWYVIEVF